MIERHFADPAPKLAELMDGAEDEDLALTTFADAHRMHIHSAKSLGRFNAEI